MVFCLGIEDLDVREIEARSNLVSQSFVRSFIEQTVEFEIGIDKSIGFYFKIHVHL